MLKGLKDPFSSVVSYGPGFRPSYCYLYRFENLSLLAADISAIVADKICFNESGHSIGLIRESLDRDIAF